MNNTKQNENKQLDTANDDFVIDMKSSLIEPTPSNPTTGTTEIKSVLAKRTYADAFFRPDQVNYDDFEDARYGQHIASDFFTTNYGHIVYYIKKIQLNIPSINIQRSETEKPIISEEMRFYMENKNLFNV
jgi:hypothetical protein